MKCYNNRYRKKYRLSNFAKNISLQYILVIDGELLDDVFLIDPAVNKVYIAV